MRHLIATYWRKRGEVASNAPYYDIRGAIQSHHRGRRLLQLTIAIAIIFGSLYEVFQTPTLVNASLGTQVLYGIVLTCVALTAIACVLVTYWALNEAQEAYLVERGVAFLRKAPAGSDARALEAILEMATYSVTGLNVRTPLPTILLTGIATVVVADRFSATLLPMAVFVVLFSLFTLSAVTIDTRVDVIIQKVIVVRRVELAQEQQQQAQRRQLLDSLGLSLQLQDILPQRIQSK